MLDDGCVTLCDRVADFCLPREAVDVAAECRAGAKVVESGRPDRIARNRQVHWRSTHHRQRLTGLEAKGRIKAQGAVVIGGLQQPDARRLEVLRTVEHMLHQLPSDT